MIVKYLAINEISMMFKRLFFYKKRLFLTLFYNVLEIKNSPEWRALLFY